MSKRAAILLCFVVLSMAVGIVFGYRLRISQEETFYSDPSFKLPVPDDLAVVPYDPHLWPEEARWN